MYRKPIIALCALVSVLVLHGCSKDPEVIKRESMRQGDAYVANKKYAEALIEYRRAVQQDPRFGEAYAKLTDTFEQTGDLNGALRSSVRAADLLPHDPAIQLKAGEFLLRARQFEDAKSRAEKALAIDPKRVEAQILRANALGGLDKFDDALAEVERAIENDPERGASYANLGAVQLLRGDAQRAEAAFKRAVDTEPKSVPARIALANFYWIANRPKEAEAQLREALTIDPENTIGNRGLAYFYMANGRAKEAEPLLLVLARTGTMGKLRLADYYVATQRGGEAEKILIEVASDESNREAFSKAKLRLAALGYASGDPTSAMKLIEEVLGRNPKYSEALLAKGQLLMSLGKPDEALEQVKAAVVAAPGSAQAQFALGMIQVFRREPAEAGAAFLEALKFRPRFAQAQLELAKLRLADGAIGEAEQFAQSALASFASYVDAHLLLVRINTLRGTPEKAERSLKALERAYPDSTAVQVEVGLLHLSRKNNIAARAAFERAFAGNPSPLAALEALTHLDIAENRAGSARARLDTVLKAHPKDTRLLLLASRTSDSLGDPPTAQRLAQRAIEADPRNLDAYGWLGHLYASEKRLGEATLQFVSMAERQPKSIPAHTIVGVLLHMQNRMPEAKAQYEKVMAMDSQAAVAANNLAWIYVETNGNMDTALRLAQTAKAQLPDRPEVNDTLGWIYVKKGLFSLAIAPLRESIAKDPAKASYYYHLGMAYVGTRETIKAREALNKSLSLDPTFSGAAAAQKALDGLKG